MMARKPNGDSRCDRASPAPGCDGSCREGGPLARRRFLAIAGAGAASLSGLAAAGAVAGPFVAQDVADHYVPADKKLAPAWVAALFARGASTWYGGSDLDTIAMPIGGVAAGQLYLTGDGRLAHWAVFNHDVNSGYGRENYRAGRKPDFPLEQGFALRARIGDKTVVRALDRRGFRAIRFSGEYPIGRVEYEDADFPIRARLEAFSPFVPLETDDSTLPATVMEFTLENRGAATAEVTIGGWLENRVLHHSAASHSATRTALVHRGHGMTAVELGCRGTEPPSETRPSVVFAEFEGKSWGDWKVAGEAFGAGPAGGTLAGQQKVSGFVGKGLVNTFREGDSPRGKLTSPEFTIDRRFVNFLIGGGSHEGKTCIRLLVGGEKVRSSHGRDDEKLTWANWNVEEFAGRRARIEIVDESSEAWGHVNIDQIEFADAPRRGAGGRLEEEPDFGTLAVSVAGDDDSSLASAALPDGSFPASVFSQSGLAGGDEARAERAIGKPLVGAVARRVTLRPGESAQVSFVVAWCFPNRPQHGNRYATRFLSATAVARHVIGDLPRLASATRLWHNTYYESTLPWWLLDRLHSTVSILATGTCQWWANGRFWGWEGVGCCHGTCGHVWNYEHALARLFPDLERSVRELQDFKPGVGLDAESGMIRFRGEGWGLWAGDSQPGYVLKAYREHQMAPDSGFLERTWSGIRKALDFLLVQDGNADGILEGKQHNTYDINFWGPNPMVGTLYLAALRAAEAMAREIGEDAYARKCLEVYRSGRQKLVEELFDGEYFEQKVDLKAHPDWQHARGCLSDQLFGQSWAHQVGLGLILPRETVEKTLRSIWKYNWTPDVGPQNAAHPPERWFARPGEAGLFTCTWPKSHHLGPKSVRYRDEVWTGIEYQVASNMAWDGLVMEALAICRGIHERYHPSRRNPWNEVECGDHYSRAMASWGVFLGLCGYEHHGPRLHLGFAPRITPERFRAAFTTAKGWGSFSQERTEGRQSERIEARHGSVEVKTLAFELPEGTRLSSATVRAGSETRALASAEQEGRRVLLELREPLRIPAGSAAEVELRT